MIYKLKAKLLNQSIKFSDAYKAYLTKIHKNPINTENHHGNNWIFIKLSQGVRIRLNYSETARFIIDYDYVNGKYTLWENDHFIVDSFVIEQPLVHAPEQLFLGLYEYCSVKCKFCPLAHSSNTTHYSLDSIYYDISQHDFHDIKSVGITTSIPPFLSEKDLGDELAFIIKKVKEKLPGIPIGVSTKSPSRETLKNLHAAGAEEIRLNLELFNESLATFLMPRKPLRAIKKALLDAVSIFGGAKVSSNFVVGIGESDEDLIRGIEWCCQNGIIPTLYPYDALDIDPELSKCSPYNSFKAPPAERLIFLAEKHYEIMRTYGVLDVELKTMCPACAASHIYPPIDMKNL